MDFADDALCRTISVTSALRTRDSGTANLGNDNADDPLSDGAVDSSAESNTLAGSCGFRAPGSWPSSQAILAQLGLAWVAGCRRRL